MVAKSNVDFTYFFGIDLDLFSLISVLKTLFLLKIAYAQLFHREKNLFKLLKCYDFFLSASRYLNGNTFDIS